MEIEYLIFGGQINYYINGTLYTHPEAVSLGNSPCSHLVPVGTTILRSGERLVGGSNVAYVDVDTDWPEQCLGTVTGEFLESTSEP